MTMKTRRSVLLVLVILLISGIAHAQPLVSLYKTLDKSPVGPWDQVLYGRIATIYVVVENAEMMVGGASFRIDDEYAFPMLAESYAPGVVIGDFNSGIEIGLTVPLPQFGTPAVIGEFQIFAQSLGSVSYWVAPHPDETTVLVSDMLGNLSAADGNTLELRSYIKPEVGIFFDEAGTQLEGSFSGGVGETAAAWLMLRDLDHEVHNAYLSLDLPDGIELVSYELPVGITMTGDFGTGAILMFDPPLGPDPGASLMASLVLTTGTEVVAGLELNVGGHSEYGSWPFVSVAPVGAYSLTPLTAVMAVPIPNEDQSWGSVKSLFR